jgi:hypothetical protein
MCSRRHSLALGFGHRLAHLRRQDPVLQGRLGQPVLRGDGEAHLSNASETFHVEYRSESGTLAYIQHARILALRLDKFDNAYFASNHNVQNTSDASDTDFLTLTATPLALSRRSSPRRLEPRLDHGTSIRCCINASWARKSLACASSRCSDAILLAALGAAVYLITGETNIGQGFRVNVHRP